MTERNEHVEALLRAFVIGKYREDHADNKRPGADCAAHLPHCPDISVTELDAYNGTYGCDTGCEYARFEATLTCPHGDSEEFEWGDFGDINEIIDDLIAMDKGSEGEPA